jgi:uncharacterized protein (UPF0261 family)
VVVAGAVGEGGGDLRRLEDREVDAARHHDPEFRLIRTSADDMLTIAGIFAERLGAAKGPLRVAVPTRGLSIPNTPDGPFWDPEADAAFLQRLRERLRPDIPVDTYDHHVNDPEFGRLVARLFLDLAQEAPA